MGVGWGIIETESRQEEKWGVLVGVGWGLHRDRVKTSKEMGWGWGVLVGVGWGITGAIQGAQGLV